MDPRTPIGVWARDLISWDRGGREEGMAPQFTPSNIEESELIRKILAALYGGPSKVTPDIYKRNVNTTNDVQAGLKRINQTPYDPVGAADRIIGGN